MIRHLVITILLLLMGPLCHAQEKVLILLSDKKGYYQEFARSAQGVLEGVTGGIQVRVRTVADAYDPDTDYDLAIAAGVKAAQHLLASKHKPGKIIYSLIPQAQKETLFGPGPLPDHHYIIFIDQPLQRYLRLAKALSPRHRVGLPYSPESVPRLDSINRAAVREAIHLNSSQINNDRELTKKLTRLLDDSDTILALPDSRIYNNNTIRAVLLTTFRARKPLIAFSDAYVKAGATAAIFSTPAQLGHQTAKTAACLIADCGDNKTKQLHPTDYTITVNRHVARLLGVAIPEESQLKKLIEQGNTHYE